MNKITVLEFISNLREGGAESLVRDYALLIDDSKFNVMTLLMGPIPDDSPYVRALRTKGRTIISIFPEIKHRGWLRKKIWNRMCFKREVRKRLLNVVTQYNVNVIHCHLELLSYIRYISKDIPDISIFFTCHNEPKLVFKKERWKNEDAAARFLFKHNKFRIIALHEHMRKEINERFGVSNTIVVHNGIDFKRFRNIPDSREAIRKSLVIPISSFVVGHIGRFAPAKNHLYMAEIFKEINQRRNDAFFLLVGSGSLRRDFEHKMSELRVSNYLILENRSDIPQLIKAMDVFILPSLWEGLPVTLVEVQAEGVRCLISDKVTEECFFSEKAVPVSIEKSPSRWAEITVDQSITGPYRNDINAFDMENVIKVIEKLYLGKYDE